MSSSRNAPVVAVGGSSTCASLAALKLERGTTSRAAWLVALVVVSIPGTLEGYRGAS